MKLEIGKRYLTRDGRTTTLLTPNKAGPPAFPFECSVLDTECNLWRRRTYQENGKYVMRDESIEDLVAEYVEPPCTETSNENPESVNHFYQKLDDTLDRVLPAARRHHYAKTFDAPFIGRVGDPETDLREANVIIARQEAELAAYRTILKGLL